MAKGSVNGSAWVESISDTVARVHIDGSYTFGPWYYYGVRVRLYVDGSQVGTNNGYTTGTYQTTARCSGYMDVTRRASSYSLSWSADSSSETVSGYGGVGESDHKGGYVSIPALPVYAPNAPTGGSATRNSDNQTTVTWANNVTATRPYANVVVERSVNGGAWSTLATLSGSAASYIDQSTSTDNAYSYRVYGRNSAGSSEAVELGTVYNTPNRPSSIGWAREVGTNVRLTLANPSNTATALDIESRAEGSSVWSPLAVVEGKVTETTVSLGGGQFYVRVRNTRGELASEWLESTKIVTLVAPNPPTLESPASSSVVSKDDGSATFRWRHNPLDGSSQTAAEIRYKVGGGEYSTQVVASEQSYTMSLEGIPVNSSVTWQARTKGAHPDYSQWSEERTFSVFQVPTVSITTPTDTVTVTPVAYAFTYSDPSGSLQNATLTVEGANGVLFSKNIGARTSGLIDRSELLLPDLGTYVLSISAQSTSTLSATATSQFRVEYDKPTGATMELQYDVEHGVVNIGVEPLVSGGQPSVSFDVQRTSSDGGWVTIASGLEGHADVLDRYAPSNKDYSYRVVTYADSGAFRETFFDARFVTPYWYVMSGGITAKAKYNPSASESIECADYSTIRYAGRKYPVLYDSGQISDMLTAGGIVIGDDEMDAFRAFQLSGGKGVYKSHDGDVLHVHGSTEISRKISHRLLYEVRMSLERIDGGAL